MSLIMVPDVGPKTVELLSKKEIRSIEDLISFYPNTYSTFNYNTLSGLFYMHGIIKNDISSYKLKRGITVSKFMLVVENTIYKVVAFNQKYLYNSFKAGDEITIYGTFDEKKNSIIMKKITHGFTDRDIFPIYPKIKGLSNLKLSKIIVNAINLSSLDEELKLHLLNLHDPGNLDLLSDALYYLKYKEFETEYLKIIDIREEMNNFDTKYIKQLNRNFKNQFIDKLPYNLTSDQTDIINDLITYALTDQKSNHLIVGDVGSGKTIVALALAFIYIKSGYQVVYLTPTAMLASQVYNQMKIFLELETYLITGETKKSEVNKIIKLIASENPMFIVGTHSLLNEAIKFSELGLIIIDEQHRFGVNQRDQLLNKGVNADVLALTATPIPRTLVKTLYGAVKVKRIANPHFKGITKTKITNKIEDLDFYVNKYQDHKVYIVVPVVDKVEESEFFDLKAIEKHICSQYVNKQVCVISSRTKNKVELINNIDTYDIIIATSVIEVGLDLYDARCMIILNAEKYGVAQLHQLRGRIGRNDSFNECILFTKTTNIKSLQRLEKIVNSNDGFELANYDLVNRGGGTLFGSKQSGNNDFKLFDLSMDMDIVQDVIEKYDDRL